MTDSVAQEAAGGELTATTDWRELCAELVDDLQEARDAVADWAAYASEYFQQKHDLQGELDRINRRLARARAVLARWGRPAPAPAGEAEYLARYLRDWGDAYGDATEFHRAADLLERQAAPVPVVVSERLPGAEDCDAEGRCWVHQPHEACPESPAWELMSAKYASANYGAMCWLPANALPLPSGEVAR